MGMAHYLAITAAELRHAETLPGKTAWMGCHFSPYGLALSNLPRELPEGSLLILDDITPIRGHDPVLIGEQLAERLHALDCSGVLLDLQRPGFPESAALAKYLSEVLPCPVAISELYAPGNDAAVFLPPVPCHLPLDEYLAPWQGREVWLEESLEGQGLTLTEDGCRISSLPRIEAPPEGFFDEKLRCHYTVQARGTEAAFTLWRTRADLSSLLKEAEILGVTHSIGLYQEFCSPTAVPFAHDQDA